MADEVIDSFSGENDWASNFYPCRFKWCGKKWESSEHAYQWSKCPTEEFYAKISACKHPKETKRLAKLLKPTEMRPNFHDVKVNLMTSILHEKFFQNKDLLKKLLATGEKTLIEGNWWNDTFWGVCRGVGQNNLGHCLMFIRDFYRDQYENH